MNTPHPSVVTIDHRSKPRYLFSGDQLVEVDLPVGTRVVYPKPPLKGLDDVDAAIRYSINHPHGCEPLYAMLKPGMKITSLWMIFRFRFRRCGPRTSANACWTLSWRCLPTTPSQTSTSSLRRVYIVRCLAKKSSEWWVPSTSSASGRIASTITTRRSRVE